MILSDISPIQYFSIFRLEDRVVNTLVLERVTRRDLDTLYICQAANNNVSVPRSASVKIDILGETELNYWYNIETLLEVSEDRGHPTPIIEKYIDCKKGSLWSIEQIFALVISPS